MSTYGKEYLEICSKRVRLSLTHPEVDLLNFHCGVLVRCCGGFED
jgi:hypothetical protein